jgi:hypothetical protein
MGPCYETTVSDRQHTKNMYPTLKLKSIPFNGKFTINIFKNNNYVVTKYYIREHHTLKFTKLLHIPMFLKCSCNISTGNNIIKNSNNKLKATAVKKSKAGHAYTVLFHTLKISFPTKYIF